ncbi:histidine kinase [Streptococcus penaeicida]|uniref:Histidine kinase n=1 Tax=Streptococcus penaeicida TaxID=1765960 RepID=A0A2N8LAC6_9STRE|nr:GHKL domain-containing protein [Streptococcus penaeicida]PND47118.1 histidine kinase [Streptococcus penaeicida]
MESIVNGLILSLIIFIDYWVIFSNTSGIKISLNRCIILFLLFTALNFLISVNIMFDPLFFILMSFLFSRGRKWSEHIFHGFFSTVLVEMIFRLLGSLFIPIFLGISIEQLNSSYQTLEMAYALVLPATYLLFYMFSVDLSIFRLINVVHLKKWLYFTNTMMACYYILFHYIMPLESPLLFYVHKYRLGLIIVYLLFLTWLFLRLNRYAKDQLQEKLYQAQTERIENLKRYNDYIEQLYREIRMVKHDSENILISLKDSIDSGDIDTIHSVYTAVVKESGNSIRSVGGTFGSLENIKESVIRSLINSKLIEAQHQGIRVYIEIPDDIEEGRLKLMDLITLLTYLMDNAIKTAKDSRNAFLSIAFFSEDDKQYFIIENSTKVKRVNILTLFEKSNTLESQCQLRMSKRFNDILESHPKVIFSTKSDYYRMRQIIEMEK